MDSFIGIIIIGIVFSIISKVSKNAKQQQQQQKNSSNTTKKTTLQSQLNKALNQINDIKTYVSDEVSNANQSNSKSVPPARNSRQQYSGTLEGHQMEGYKVEGHQMEGHIVEGHQVEGHQVEGIAQKHSTNKFSRDRIAVTENSMNKGYAGEGCDDHYDMDIAYTSGTRKIPRRKPLYFSANPIIQGVVMSQILDRGKRR